MEVTYRPAERASAAEADLSSAAGLRGRPELEQLADEVRRHHRDVERHARSMLHEAIAAGEALIEAKGLLRHGEFGPWLTYCGLNQRTAQLYMKLAREKRNVAVLEAESIRGALEALGGKPKREPPQLPGFFDSPDWPPSYAGDEAWVEHALAVDRVEREIEAIIRGKVVSFLEIDPDGCPRVTLKRPLPSGGWRRLRESGWRREDLAELPPEKLCALRDTLDHVLRERGNTP